MRKCQFGHFYVGIALPWQRSALSGCWLSGCISSLYMLWIQDFLKVSSLLWERASLDIFMWELQCLGRGLHSLGAFVVYTCSGSIIFLKDSSLLWDAASLDNMCYQNIQINLKFPCFGLYFGLYHLKYRSHWPIFSCAYRDKPYHWFSQCELRICLYIS